MSIGLGEGFEILFICLFIYGDLGVHRVPTSVMCVFPPGIPQVPSCSISCSHQQYTLDPVSFGQDFKKNLLQAYS